MIELIEDKNKEYFNDVIEISRDLSLWFSEDAVRNIKLDCKYNHVIIAKYEGESIGFLCYTVMNCSIRLIWIGIKKNYQNKGIGSKFIQFLEKKAKELNLNFIEVETLSDRDSYEPYIKTRKFYLKHGFKKSHYKTIKIPGLEEMIVLIKKI